MKLLIAEDDASLLRALTAFFQKNNFTVDGVTNGSDALDYLRLGYYDAAVLDVMMPLTDGVTVTKKPPIPTKRPIILPQTRFSATALTASYPRNSS